MNVDRRRIHCRSRQFPLLLPLLLLAASSAHADIVNVAPDLDNTMYSEGGNTNNSISNGAGDYFFTGATAGSALRRGLVSFDVAAAVPSGSTINSVTLTLYVSRGTVNSQTVALHRVLSEWGEGTSDASGEEGQGTTATTGDATWSHREWSTNLWTVAGGDYEPTQSASLVVGALDAYYAWADAQMTADVQGWLDTPASNFGWIVIGNEAGSGTTKRFDSRENSNPTRRPELQIDFTPPVPTGACCADDGGCSVVADPGSSCMTPSVYQGSGTTCDPNLCPQPTGACCTADASGTCNEYTLDACTTAGGSFIGNFTTCAATMCPIIPTPFSDVLSLPPVAQPVSGSVGGAASYDIAMREVSVQVHSELPPTTVWAYGDGPTGASYPGPTVEASTDQAVTVNWINDLRDTSQAGDPLRSDHYLPVDTCPHGAEDSAKAVVHLHGAHVPAAYDGHPELTYLPGNQETYVYPNHQDASTLWYHDHALGLTRLNVYMGLSGFYLIRDAVENALGLPSDAYELPLLIQDRSFNADGSWKYPAVWQDMFFGDTMLVNGKVWPTHTVDQGKYRLRLLNGSNSRTLRLQFCPGSNTVPCPSPANFQLIGQDGGLLTAPLTLNEVTLGGAERADIVLDFASYAGGSAVYLQNTAPAPFPGTPGVGELHDVMRFDVQAVAGHTAAVPGTLRTIEVLDEQDSVATRILEIQKGPGGACSPFAWEIVSKDVMNGTVLGSHWTDVTELPNIDDTEVWTFINRSGMTHPMHMHLVFFQLLDRQLFDDVGGNVVPIGSPTPPAPHEMGWKDTIQVHPGEIVRVIARFEDYTGLFPYHCHILEHEDHEMMREFRVVPEPIPLLALASGALALGWLARRRARRG